MMRFQITLGGTLAGLRVTDAGVPTAVFILLKIVLRAATAILHNNDRLRTRMYHGSSR